MSYKQNITPGESKEAAMTQFDIGSQWRTYGGWRAMILSSHKVGGVMRVWHEYDDRIIVTSGTTGQSLEQNVTPTSSYDLDVPWREPESGVCWVHVLKRPKNMGITVLKKPESFEATDDLIARIRVPWTEGQFDEPKEGSGDDT